MQTHRLLTAMMSPLCAGAIVAGLLAKYDPGKSSIARQDDVYRTFRCILYDFQREALLRSLTISEERVGTIIIQKSKWRAAEGGGLDARRGHSNEIHCGARIAPPRLEHWTPARGRRSQLVRGRGYPPGTGLTLLARTFGRGLRRHTHSAGNDVVHRASPEQLSPLPALYQRPLPPRFQCHLRGATSALLHLQE